MRISILAGCILIMITLVPFVVAEKNVTDSGLALHGYDPVSYHGGEPLQGREKFAVIHDGAKYLFSNRANMQAFEADPQKYLPAFGGWCAWAMLDGEKVDVDPERFKIISGRTYLFYNSFFVDTLKKWNTLAEEESEKALVSEAARQWQALSMK